MGISISLTTLDSLYDQAYLKVLPMPSLRVAMMVTIHHLLWAHSGSPSSFNTTPSTSYGSRKPPIPNERMLAMLSWWMIGLRPFTLLGRLTVSKQVMSGIWMSQAFRWCRVARRLVSMWCWCHTEEAPSTKVSLDSLCR